MFLSVFSHGSHFHSSDFKRLKVKVVLNYEILTNLEILPLLFDFRQNVYSTYGFCNG